MLPKFKALALTMAVVATPLWAQADPELEYWMREANQALQEKDSTKAYQALEQVLSIDPGNPTALSLKASLDPQGGQLNVSQGMSASVLGTDPGVLGYGVSPEQALELLREDPYRQDAEELKKVLGLDYGKKAQALEAEGKKGAAMVAFRRALFFNPSDPMIHYEFFQALMKRGRLKEALGEGETFLELQSSGALASEMRRQLVEVHTRLGAKQMKANRWDVAIEHFQKVLRNKQGPREFGEVEEKLAVCYYTLGVRENANGRRLPACRAFSSLLELRPEAGVARETFDSQYFDKLSSSALSPLWNQGKKSKEEGRLIEAYRFFGHVLTLGKQGWMLKLSKQYRQEIKELAGESVDAEEARVRAGMPWGGDVRTDPRIVPMSGSPAPSVNLAPLGQSETLRSSPVLEGDLRTIKPLAERPLTQAELDAQLYGRTLGSP